MTRNDPTGDAEFIRHLERYLDEYEGLTPLPYAVRDAVRAELPTAKQIGPVTGLMRDIYMTSIMDSPARWGLVAAVIIGAVIIGGALVLSDNVGGPGPSASVTPSPTASQAAAVYGPEDLSEIVLTADNAPDGFTVDRREGGAAAYTIPFPEGFAIDYTGFSDALTTNLNSTDGGGLVSWAAVFGTEAEAIDAYAQVRRAHEETDGWGLTPMTASGLGPESVSYVGAAYAWDAATIYLWRVDNLVLAAVSVGDADPQLARDIADEMQARTQGL